MSAGSEGQRRVKKRGALKPWGGRRVSPLTLRILAVNVLALAILVAGVLYLNQYRDILIERELDSLQAEAQLFANALAEGAVVRLPKQTHALAEQLVRPMVVRLSETARNRTRVFNARGEIIADSAILGTGNDIIEAEPLPPLGAPRHWESRLKDLVDGLIGLMPGASAQRALPVLDTAGMGDAKSFPGVVSALNGQIAASAWRDPTLDQPLLIATAPVQRFKQVLGAVLITRGGDSIQAAVREQRIAILQVFGCALLITTLLSLYLARTISRPIRRLALGTESIGAGSAKDAVEEIPDFTARGDEIGDLSGTLRAVTKALYARMDAIERFAADVAHEIKNPLTSLRSAVETAARVKDPEQQKHLMAIIQDDVIRLDRLISDISNASRLDAEMSRSEIEPVDLGRLLDTLVEMQRMALDSGESEDTAQNIAITLDRPEGEALIVPGLEGRLYQVFQNIVANAISFSPAGGTVHLCARKEDGRVIVTVEDTGPGIPQGKLEAIFDRFYSERPEGEKFGQHSGLGLSISKQIIDAHKGTITAHNRLDGDGRIAGAAFTITLPAYRD